MAGVSAPADEPSPDSPAAEVASRALGGGDGGGNGADEQVLKVDIWSDVICPWCYIGKTRFDEALARFEGPGRIEVEYHAYQLDPTAAPGVTMPVAEAYARKFGGPERARQIIDELTAVAAGDGLDFRLDQAKRANTLLAHRAIWFAATHRRQAALKERLMAAYFTEGRNIGDPDELASLAAEVGLDEVEVAAFLTSTEGAGEVAEDLAQAAAYGITAVPTYVVDGRWSIPGAQDVDTFVQVLTRMANRLHASAT